MEKQLVEHIESLSISEVKEIKRNELCEGCGLWPCYATAPECFKYEEDES